MGCRFARLSQNVWINLLSLIVTVFVLVCSAAGAEVYDDFNGENIDTAKWTIRSTSGGAPGLFTQSKGRLNFSCKKDAGESLISTKSFQPGFFRIEFYDFYSTNDAPSGRGMGSFVALGLGPRDNYVRMLRGRVGTGGYFEANHFTNNGLNLWYDRTMAGSGQLALYYDGSTVSFFYDLGLNPNKGWQRVGPRVSPEWNFPPQLFISGYPGPSGLTKFSVDNVEYTPLPLPPSLLKKLER